MFDPMVEHPLIEDVFIAGEVDPVPASTFLGGDRRNLATIRLEFEDAIRAGNPIARCAACHRPVKPRLSRLRRRFFRHDGGDGNCPYRTSGGKNQQLIDAMRYNGQKEGLAHIRLKNLMVDSIVADPAFDKERLAVEERWWGSTDTGKWRKPDIAVWYGDLRVAFEIQLSTTFLSVMAARRSFYLENGGLLFWIFEKAQMDNPRQFQDDVFYNNNSNLFIVDDETTQLSQEKGELMLRCCYFEPLPDQGSLREEWRTAVVPFSALTIEQGRQRAYFFDCEGALKHLEAELSAEYAREAALRQKQHALDLRNEFFGYWQTYRYTGCSSDKAQADYQRLHNIFRLSGIGVPARMNEDFARFLCLVLSAAQGKPIGFDHRTLLEVANFAYDNCKPLLWYFCTVLKAFGSLEILLQEDQRAAARKRAQGKKHTDWTEKLEVIRMGIRRWRKDKTGVFPEDRKYDSLFYCLFPELQQRTEAN